MGPRGGGGSSPATPFPPPPAGACISNDPAIDYTVACKALEASCELYSFCQREPSLTQSAAHAAQRKRFRRPSHRMLLQRGSELQYGAPADDVEEEEEEAVELEM